MEARAAAIRDEYAPGNWSGWSSIPPLYTAGTSARDPADLIAPGRFPVYPAGRGGQATPIMGRASGSATSCSISTGAGVTSATSCIRSRRWLIDALWPGSASLGACRGEGRVGIWVDRRRGRSEGRRHRGPGPTLGDASTASAINVDPDLGHFARHRTMRSVRNIRVTSLSDGRELVADMKQFDRALRDGFEAFLSALVSVHMQRCLRRLEARRLTIPRVCSHRVDHKRAAQHWLGSLLMRTLFTKLDDTGTMIAAAALTVLRPATTRPRRPIPPTPT